MRSFQLYTFAVLSGLLLAFSWFPDGFCPLIFIAFIPLLRMEKEAADYPEKFRGATFFFASYLCFFTWNILVTWWVKNASWGGAALAILANSLLMAMVFALFHRIKMRLGAAWSYTIFISFWITFEFLHLGWDLSWPWLTLGNVFGGCRDAVQWYEYTGIFGGSLWVLLSNVIIFELLMSFRNLGKSGRLRGLSLVIAILIVPLLFSWYCKPVQVTGNTRPVNVVIVQPDIDPYNEKFVVDFEEQLLKMYSLAAKKVDSTTDYLVFPETALTEDIWENSMEQSKSIRFIRGFLRKFPQLTVITGASTVRSYEPGEKLSSTARKFSDGDGYYDSFNTALQIDSSGVTGLYHKSKLVPGVEKMPFPAVFKYLEKFAIALGGTSGSLGMQEERTVFKSGRGLHSAPVICYESIYGDYVGQYIRNGADFITIITNDGWWGDTPGYRQHLQYGALRAIETRKWIVRSANTGISCVIDPAGNIIDPAVWWTPAVLKETIGINKGETFYTRYGDYIGKAAFCVAMALLLYSAILRLCRIPKKW